MKRSNLFAGILMYLLSACGGGSSSSAPSPTGTAPPAPPVSTNVTAAGVITGFSSVFVDGVKYDVDSDTVVAIEGDPEITGDDSALKVGMKVSVQASESNSGQRTAHRIDYDEDLKGPVRDVMPDPLNPALGKFSLLQQSVIVDANTLFDDDVGDNNGDGAIDIRDLTLPNNDLLVVEVSGLQITDGFVATRIDRDSDALGIPDIDGDEFELKGIVDSIAADGLSFTINNATIMVIEGAGGTEFEDGLVADDTLVGQYVEVELDEDSNGDLIAVNVELEGRLMDRDENDRDDKFEISGILMSVDTNLTPNEATIGGTTLKISDASALAGLQGTRIELKGTFDDNNVLLLSRIQTQIENNIRIEDRVDMVDIAAGTIQTRLGVTITPTGASRIRDRQAAGGDHLSPDEFIARIQPNDYLEARAFTNVDGETTWTRVEREDEDDQECRLRGPVSAVNGDSENDFSFVVQDITIDVSQVSDNNFQGSSDQSIGRQVFFEQLDVGDVVQAKSDDQGNGCAPGVLTGREVEFEVDDGLVGSMPPTSGDPAGDDGADDNFDRELTGTPTDVQVNSFLLNGQLITVVGSTLIDDSIIEAALGREFDGDDQRFDQVPAGLTLVDLLPSTVAINVTRTSDNIALSIEDL